MSPVQEIRFRLVLTSGEYLAYYRGEARQIVVQALDGRRIRFPAGVLRPYLTHEGIVGEFALQYDEHRRFVGIRKV